MNRKLSTLAIAISAATLLSACNDNNDNRTELQKAQGVWLRTSYGEVVEIDEDYVTQYQVNSQGCIQVSKQNHQQAKNSHFIQVLRVDDTLKVNDDTNISIYSSADKLPDLCNNPIVVKNNTKPSEVFTYFWHTFNDYYAFFDIRALDWQAQYQAYAPLIDDAMADDELFELLAQMVAPLQDAHVYIESDEQEFNVIKPSPILRSAEGQAKSYLRFGFDVDTMDVVESILEEYEDTTISYITTDSLQTFPADDSPKTLIWGKTYDNVGILVINNMAEFHTAPGANEQQHLLAAEQHIERIMLALKDTDGMIIDIRNNLGGEDAIAKVFAKHFNEKESIAFHKRANNRAGLGPQSHHVLATVKHPYLKPVYLLTSQITVSAGEVFAMMMKQLPQVIHVGEETSGAFSDVLRFTLPNGWEIGLSNEVYRNAAGKSFEAIGLQPDVEVPAFSNLSGELQHFASYDYALAALGKQTYSSISVTSFESQVTDLISQSGLPGLAVAIVQNGKMTYSQGFGMANVQGAPVHADTPFYLASVSKTLVGATLAHAVSTGETSVDEPIAPLLPFAINATSALETPITFRHLITHTSGIIDELSTYTCAYYLHETMQSVNNALLGKDICDEQINPDIGTYLSNYLTHSGSTYQQQNFTAQYGYGTGDVYVYSNIATALAAFALEQKLHTPFVELVQSYVFEPLSMHDSHWGVGPTADNVATRFVFLEKDNTLMPMPDYGAITYADGSAISTVNDLARFLIASMNQGKIDQQQALLEDTVLTMLSPQTDTPTPSRDIGYFWELDGDIIHHDGSDPGVMSQLIGDLKHNTGVVLLSNGDDDHQAHEEAMYAIQQLALQLAYSK